jgi:hypothetical protein
MPAKTCFMNEQSRVRANLITDNLERLNGSKRSWEKATQWYSSGSATAYGDGSDFKVAMSYVDFDLVKTLALASINKQINELQKEFAAL